jgi:hypothetical protein
MVEQQLKSKSAQSMVVSDFCRCRAVVLLSSERQKSTVCNLPVIMKPPVLPPLPKDFYSVNSTGKVHTTVISTATDTCNLMVSW